SFIPGPLSPEQPLWLVLAGGAPWLTRVDRAFIRAGTPLPAPWVVVGFPGAQTTFFVVAPFAVPRGRTHAWPTDASQKGVGRPEMSIRQAPIPWHILGVVEVVLLLVEVLVVELDVDVLLLVEVLVLLVEVLVLDVLVDVLVEVDDELLEVLVDVLELLL